MKRTRFIPVYGCTMKLHILNDLHIEFEDFDPPATDADVVILPAISVWVWKACAGRNSGSRTGR